MITGTANTNDYSETYTYNALGNLLTKNGTAYSHTGNAGTNYANPHAVTKVGTAILTYDKNGNLLTDGTMTNTWNYRDQITATKIGTTITGNAYDHNGTRKRMVVGTANMYYPNRYYNANDGNVKKTKNIYAGDMLVATVENGVAYYVATDHLGGTNVITDSSGKQSELLDYLPYGGVRLDEKASTFETKRGYIGEYFDKSTGLNYLNARHYNSAKGRFLSEDPVFWEINPEYLIDPQQWNSYSYALNNPIGNIDSDGKKVYAVAKAIEAKASGTHVFLFITPDNPSDFGMKEGSGWTLGGYMGDDGNLIKATNAPSDISVIQNGYSMPKQQRGEMKSIMEVQAPSGISDTGFIKNITSQYNSYSEDAAMIHL